MSEFADKLNDMIVETFRTVLKAEEQALKSSGNTNLSISEIHLIEAVGKNKEDGFTISEIAEKLDITLSSVTIAINKLANKGYVSKIKSESDGRMVHVMLTRAGTRINRAHAFFHRRLATQLSDGFSEEEKRVLLEGIKRINDFFSGSLAVMEG